MSLQEKFR